MKNIYNKNEIFFRQRKLFFNTFFWILIKETLIGALAVRASGEKLSKLYTFYGIFNNFNFKL